MLVQRLTLLFFVCVALDTPGSFAGNLDSPFPECREKYEKELADGKKNDREVTSPIPSGSQVLFPPKKSASGAKCVDGLDVSHSIGLQTLPPYLDTFRVAATQSLMQNIKPYELEAYHHLINCGTNLQDFHKDAEQASANIYDGITIPGYEIVSGSKATPSASARYYFLQPVGGPRPNKPLIFAIEGTHSFTDAANDLSFGNAYLQILLSDPGAKGEIVRALEKGEDVTLTGHSLGGGLSEGLAAEIEHQLALDQYTAEQHNQSIKLGKLRVVTFNGFGGKSLEANLTLTQKLNGATTPAQQQARATIEATAQYKAIDHSLAQSILDQTVNYRMQGDRVSQLGRHYGQIRTVTNDLVMFPQLTVLSDHKIDNLVFSFQFGAPQTVTEASNSSYGVGDITTTVVAVGSEAAVKVGIGAINELTKLDDQLRKVSRTFNDLAVFLVP